MLKLNKWEKLVLQDLVLLFVGAFLVLSTIIGFLNSVGLITLLVGYGFMCFGMFDLAKLLFKK